MSSTHTSVGWLVGLEYKFENHWAGSGGDQCYSQDGPQTFIKEVGYRWQNCDHRFIQPVPQNMIAQTEA